MDESDRKIKTIIIIRAMLLLAVHAPSAVAPPTQLQIGSSSLSPILASTTMPQPIRRMRTRVMTLRSFQTASTRKAGPSRVATGISRGTETGEG
jgi:hypothetical protein